jgi:ascorbate-specific PTS system EIIC-type component UlaA
VVTEPELFGPGGISDLLRSVGDMTDNAVNLLLKDFAEELSKQKAFDEVHILFLVIAFVGHILYVWFSRLRRAWWACVMRDWTQPVG